MATPQNGVVAVRHNGQPLIIKGTVTYSLGGKMREDIVGPTGLVGHSVKGSAAFCQVVSMDTADLDLAALKAVQDETVTLSLENGKTISFPNASVTGDLEVTTDEGEFTVRFSSPTAEEL